MRITISKLRAIVITVALIIIGCVSNKILGNIAKNNDVEQALIMASAICCIFVLLEFASWIRLTGELLCPYTVFLLVLFLFCCGQAIGWVLHIDMGNKDMWDRIDHNMSKHLLLQGLTYSNIGILFFHLGAIITTKCDRYYSKTAKWSAEEVREAFKGIGKILLIICIPAFLANTYMSVMQVIQSGYAGIYTFQQNSSMVMRFLNILSNYYQPCLLILLIAYNDEIRKRRWIVMAMMLDVIINLFIGGRSGAVMSLLAIILAFHYFVQPFTKRQFALGAVGGYFGIAILNAVADIRDVANRNLLDFFPMLFSSLSNVIGEFIGELGWSITSVCWTMNLVPGSYEFRHGMSYLVSLISWIPSQFFTGTHPVVVWGELSTWLQKALNMTYGPGYTMVAEAYLNFGYMGYIALFAEGMIVSYMIAQISRIDANRNLLKSTMQIMVIMILMKSLVRSSVSIAFRQYIFVLLPLYILIRLSIRRGENINGNRNSNMA